MGGDMTMHSTIVMSCHSAINVSMPKDIGAMPSKNPPFDDNCFVIDAALQKQSHTNRIYTIDVTHFINCLNYGTMNNNSKFRFFT